MTHEVHCLFPVYSITSFWLVSPEKILLHRMSEWKRAFQCFFGSLKIFHFDLTPVCMQIWSGLKYTLKATVICNLKQLTSSSTKLIHMAYSQMGRRFIPYQFGCLLWLGNNAQTLLKAKIGDHEPSGRKMALAQSLSKSLLMFETFQKSLCSLVALIIPVWVWMKTF